MTKKNKGLLMVVLVMVPVLWSVVGAVTRVSDSGTALLSAIVGVFVLVNLFGACLCAEEPTAEKVFFLFIWYLFVTFFSTIFLVIIVFFIALKTGVLTLGKIGG